MRIELSIMKIESNNGPMDVTGLESRAAALRTNVRQVQKQDKQDNVSLNSMDELKKSLNEAPAVRADKVAKAKALVADSSYPSDSTLSQVAGLLADNLNGQTQYTTNQAK